MPYYSDISRYSNIFQYPNIGFPDIHSDRYSNIGRYLNMPLPIFKYQDFQEVQRLFVFQYLQAFRLVLIRNVTPGEHVINRAILIDNP